MTPPVSTEHGVHLAAGLDHRGDDAVQVVLTLAVLPVEPGQGLEQRAASEREQHDRDLADRPDLGGGVDVLHDLDEPGAAPHDAAVAAWVLEHGRSDRRRGSRAPMRGDEPLHVVVGDGVEVARHHEHVVGAAHRPLGDLHRVAGAELSRLLDEHRRRRELPGRDGSPAHRRRRDRRRRSPSTDALRAPPAPCATARAGHRWGATPWGLRTSDACPYRRRARPRRGSGMCVSGRGQPSSSRARRVEAQWRRAVMVPHRPARHPSRTPRLRSPRARSEPFNA